MNLWMYDRRWWTSVLFSKPPLWPTWGCDAATVRWLPPEEGGTRLTVAHFRKGGPTYDDALSRLGDLPGRLLLMLPTDLAAAVRQELECYVGLRVGWEAVADGS